MGSFPRLLAAAFAAVFVLAATGEPLAAPAEPAKPVAVEILRELNAARTRRGLRPLVLSRPLTAAADYHTRDMGARGYFSHTSKDGTSFLKRIRRFYQPAGYTSWYAGENILWGAGTVDAKTAVRLWMGSRGHRRNILAPGWREVGISARTFASAPGTFRGRAVTIVTTDFGTRVAAEPR
jgi:uncharacterized protein YkwD